MRGLGLACEGRHEAGNIGLSDCQQRLDLLRRQIDRTRRAAGVVALDRVRGHERQFVVGHGSVVDVGCGNGELLRQSGEAKNRAGLSGGQVFGVTRPGRGAALDRRGWHIGQVGVCDRVVTDRRSHDCILNECGRGDLGRVGAVDSGRRGRGA